MSWVGGGFFQPMLHVVYDNSRSSELDGQQFWWSRCDTMCVELPAGADLSEIPLCPQCFLPVVPAGDHDQPSSAAEEPPSDPDRTVGWFEPCNS